MDTAELSKYAKNYLPLLFNIFTESPSTVDSKSFILDCIRSYASIADPQVCHRVCHWSLSKCVTTVVAGEVC